MKTNKIFKALALILALAMILTVAGCAGSGTESSTTESSTTESSTTEESSATTEESEGETEEGETPVEWAREGPDDTTEFYEFEVYYNYDWWTVQPFGEDAASKALGEKFNVAFTETKPDSDAAAKLNLLITGGNLPEVIYMDQGSEYQKVVRQGVFVPLSQLKYEGNEYDAAVSQASQNLIAVDGEVYIWPNWVRKGATGGNDGWQILRSVWEANDSPEMTTMEEMHDFLLEIVENGTCVNANGDTIVPFMTGETGDGSKILGAFHRAQGRPLRPLTWWSAQEGGSNAEICYILDDEYIVAALREANKWYRDGLIPQTSFTDSVDQTKEKLTTAQAAVLYYDFSQDSVFKYNQLVEEKQGDRYILFGYEVPNTPIYLTMADAEYPAFGDANGTCSGGGPNITVEAENPYRIFDMYSWMYSWDGSINMMYGPEGLLWEGKDENGVPQMIKPEAEYTADEKNAAGCWLWARPASADNVDTCKFAVNEQAPEEYKDWTISIQANVYSPDETDDDPISLPGQKYVCDDFANLTAAIDSTTDLGVNVQMISDKSAANIPMMIMAESDEEFDRLLNETLEYVNSQNKEEIAKIYTDKMHSNIETAGYSYYDLFYEAYEG